MQKIQLAKTKGPRKIGQLRAIQRSLKIQNKRKEIVAFKLNAAQRWYWERKTRRNLILKARQKGLSKIIDGDQFIQCIRRPTNAVVISHERGATERLFAAVKFYMENLKVKPEVSEDSARLLKFPQIGSSYYVGTAGQKAFGRGDTIDRAHLSEAAFYPDLENTLAGVAEAAEYGQIDIETTPNGREKFYDMWQLAKDGRSPYTPIFIPWYIDEEYSSENMTEEERKGLSPSVQALFDQPADEFIYTDEEKDLIKRVWNDHAIMLTMGQIKWRRYKIWDKGDLFFQEYPEDDVSCFLQTGRSVFTKIKTDPSLRIPLDHVEKMKPEDRDRLLGNKEKGIKPKTLYAGLDPSEGTLTGDPHSLAIIEPNSPYHPENGAVVIYELTTNEPIDSFGLKTARLCQVFDILLGVEKAGVGAAMVRELREYEIWFLEWITSATSRPIMITDIEKAYRHEDLIETYPEAEDEARNMIYKQNDRAEHPNGKHDDRLFARAIAVQMLNQAKPGIEFF